MSYQEGNSEEVLGRALRDFAKREDYIVATKFLPRSEDEIRTGAAAKMRKDTIGHMDFTVFTVYTIK